MQYISFYIPFVPVLLLQVSSHMPSVSSVVRLAISLALVLIILVVSTPEVIATHYIQVLIIDSGRE